MSKREQGAVYIPGKCNIGSQEITSRYRLGFAGVILGLLFVVLVYLLQLPQSWRLLICLPAGMAIAGFLQASRRFCFMYGLRGVFSMTQLRNVTQIVDPDQIRRDKKTALLLIGIVIVGTSLITAIYYYW